MAGPLPLLTTSLLALRWAHTQIMLGPDVGNLAASAAMITIPTVLIVFLMYVHHPTKPHNAKADPCWCWWHSVQSGTFSKVVSITLAVVGVLLYILCMVFFYKASTTEPGMGSMHLPAPRCVDPNTKLPTAVTAAAGIIPRRHPGHSTPASATTLVTCEGLWHVCG